MCPASRTPTAAPIKVTYSISTNARFSEAYRYAPLVISGAMIILFSIEHLIALINGTDVEPAWN